MKLRAIIFLLPSLFFATDGFSFEKSDDSVTSLFAKHCLNCHGENGEVNGEVDLRGISAASDLIEQPSLLRNLVRVIDQGEMPPDDVPPLEDKSRELLLNELQSRLQQSIANSKNHAHTAIRRMNRFQYNNAVVDLFKLNCVVFTLPERMLREHGNYFRPDTGEMADTVTVGCRPLGKSQLIEPRLAGVTAFPQDLRAENGFDNRADHLSLSPLLMESFLRLGQSITTSADFNKKRVGIWNDFFEQPRELDLENRDELETAIRDRLQPFLTRAFRKPVKPAELDRYTEFALANFERSNQFADAMKSLAAAAISSPKFLYQYDRSSQNTGKESVTDLELASRLSFFLWGSIPDEELLNLAIANKLSDESVLAEQVDRMLRDKKIKRFCDSFPTQWLQLERIVSSVPNREKFPGFFFLKYRDSMHMLVEPLLLFETVLIENKSITNFIDSDFTYRSLTLRDAYNEDIPDDDRKKRRGNEVTVLTFDRLPVSNRRDGGMITNAAVMTMTSGTNRTKPITRGAWLATVIFNDAPKPPPADVPPLDENPSESEQDLTLRERLSKHRERADCRGCHEQIDPLGFALENFDPIGVWREEYDNGREIDVSGKLFRKHDFSNVGEFKDAILAEKDRFAKGFAGHVLSFALARELEFADESALEKIAQQTAEDGYRIQTLMKQIVLSEPFRRTSASSGSKDKDVKR